MPLMNEWMKFKGFFEIIQGSSNCVVLQEMLSC